MTYTKLTIQRQQKQNLIKAKDQMKAGADDFEFVSEVISVGAVELESVSLNCHFPSTPQMHLYPPQFIPTTSGFTQRSVAKDLLV